MESALPIIFVSKEDKSVNHRFHLRSLENLDLHQERLCDAFISHSVWNQYIKNLFALKTAPAL